MKYAQGPTVAIASHIAASASTVWSIVSDIALPTRFSTEVRSVEWIGDDVAPRLGARFVGHSVHEAAGQWSTTSEITALHEPQVFQWSVLGADDVPSSVWRFTITDHGDGSVQLEQWMQMGPARSGINPAIDRMPEKEDRIIERRLAEHRVNMERNLVGIKAIAEGSEMTTVPGLDSREPTGSAER